MSFGGKLDNILNECNPKVSIILLDEMNGWVETI